MNIAIVDDQKEFSENIQTIISDMNHHFYSFTSVLDMEKTEIHFDLILLDIDMPDCDGVHYAQEHLNKNIVFITSQRQRMKEAFGHNIYGFIEKKDTEKRYYQVIDQAIHQISNQKTIQFNSDGDRVCLVQNHIAYFMYIKHKTVSIMYENKEYIIKGYTLSEIKENLDSYFVYISRDIIINSHMIVEYIDNKIYLRGIRENFIVSRRRKNDIVKVMRKDHE